MSRSGQPTVHTVQVEQLLEAAIGRGPADGETGRMLRDLAAFDCRDTRVVVFGGGTGLSTVVGGNSQLPEWPGQPFVGLKQEFLHLDVVVCTTDDGRSTGRLLQDLPMIGIGDLRKLCLSLVLPDRLPGGTTAAETVRIVHRIFNSRFSPGSRDFATMADPLRCLDRRLRRACPSQLADFLRRAGSYLTPGGGGPVVAPGGHCLGNLLLTAEVFRAAGRADRPPGGAALRQGLDACLRALGAVPGRLHPATATPGQLLIRYANGVEVRGQHKAALTRRGVAVERVEVEFCGRPRVSARVLRAIQEADLIVFAPGSLYTSSIPILQVPHIAAAIRDNCHALKILGANFWAQEGETDISHNSRDRSFRVSELVEAYARNVPGGPGGLFDVVLSANLAPIPGTVLRNYALEGKRPIYLDRERVERQGVRSLEATVYSLERLTRAGVIHHDPQAFTAAIRVLLFLHRRFGVTAGAVPAPQPPRALLPGTRPAAARPLCVYCAGTKALLARKSWHPALLRRELQDLLWENRDICQDHLKFFQGARIVEAEQWNRSTDWDNVLGYYDPQDGFLKINGQLRHDRERLRRNLLVALGESLLGRYLQERRWLMQERAEAWGIRCYEIRLRDSAQRHCFLTPDQLRRYLILARMVPSPRDERTFRLTLNDGEGFVPPGLLFGLLYAWYLDNSYGEILEHDMSLLHRPPELLIPHQLREYCRWQSLVDFFRTVVFGYPC